MTDAPSETKNIIQERPEIAAKMKQALFSWKKTMENSAQGMDYNQQTD